MRSRLSKRNMGLVMKISRKHNLKITNVLDFILDNPDVILITRGEINDEKCAETCKKEGNSGKN